MTPAKRRIIHKAGNGECLECRNFALPDRQRCAKHLKRHSDEAMQRYRRIVGRPTRTMRRYTWG